MCCKETFPSVQFLHADARSMGRFSDESFDLVFFSCNGISMVDHPGRLAILSEVHRILAKGGTFIFSTCNRDSPQFRRRFSFPRLHTTLNPLKLLARSAAFLAGTLERIANRSRYRRLETREQHYAIINDTCHNYRTMLYFITPDSQRQQLISSGFRRDIFCYDLSGNRVDATLRQSGIHRAYRIGMGTTNRMSSAYRETALSFGPNNGLVGVVTCPLEQQSTAPLGVLLLNAGLVHRVDGSAAVVERLPSMLA